MRVRVYTCIYMYGKSGERHNEIRAAVKRGVFFEYPRTYSFSRRTLLHGVRWGVGKESEWHSG
jgi:hypothetical protein